jgi:Flp pilus assembly protein TadG
MKSGSFFKKYREDKKGAVAIMFALALAPMLMVAGSAVDYVRMTDLKTKLQSAIDAGALAAAASHDQSKEKQKRLALDTFRKNFGAENMKSLGIAPVVGISDDKISLSVKTKNPTGFLRIAGIDALNIDVKSVVNRNFGELEVSLVLDNTG